MSSVFISTEDARRGWRDALPAFVVLVLIVLVLYRDSALAMVEIWRRSDTFAHAFLVPPIVLWLVWRRRDVLAGLPTKPQPWTLVPIAFLAIIWLLGELVAVNAVTQLALTALLVLAVPAVLGLPVARALMFPLAFLFFAVPIGDFTQPLMMEWTADFTVAAVRLSGVPVHREGLQFVIPSGSWSVVEACSGVRYLIASFMVGTLFAYLNYQTPWRRWTFVGVSILVPIVANWLRAYMIVMIGHLSGNRLAVGVDHLIYGWVFFGVVIGIMFVIGARWSEPEAASVVAVRTMSQLGSAGQQRSVSGWSVAMLAAALLALPHLTLRAIAGAESNRAPTLSLPETLPGSWAAAPEATPWQPAFQNAAAQQSQLYRQGEREVGAYVAYYRNQNYETKLVSSENRLVRSEDYRWNRVDSGWRDVQAGGADLRLRSTYLRAQGLGPGAAPHEMLVWQTYWVNGRWMTSDAQAKLYGAVLRLLGQGDDGAVVVVYTIGEDRAALERAMSEFSASAWPALEASLRQTRSQR